MIFSVFADLNKSEAKNIALNLLNILNNESCSVYFSSEYQKELAGENCKFAEEERLYDICDIAVAVGGDGTTMKVARNAAVHGKSALGINGGRLGFLSTIEKNELNLLKCVVSGDYSVDDRIMIKAEVFENGELKSTYHCLNDAVLSRGDFSRLIDFDVQSDGRELLRVRADGVIFSTPTGSTAYSLAAGGPVLSTDLDCFVITSICPHSLMDRSIVVNSKNSLKISVCSDVSNDAVLTCDGEKSVLIPNDSYVKISLSEYKAHLIKIKPDNFYEIVKKKIVERRI